MTAPLHPLSEPGTMYYTPDCVHLTDAGYWFAADLINAVLDAADLPVPGTIEAFIVEWLYRIALSPLAVASARRAAARYVMWYEACVRLGSPTASA